MRGQWIITYKSLTPGSCIFTANITTTMAITYGFLSAEPGQSINSDTPLSVFPASIPLYFVAHATGLNWPGQILSLEVYQGSTLTFSSPAQTRYKCAYETYFGTVTCSISATPYYFKVMRLQSRQRKLLLLQYLVERF